MGSAREITWVGQGSAAKAKRRSGRRNYLQEFKCSFIMRNSIILASFIAFLVRF